MSECHKCGQWPIGEGGAGCHCGQKICPGCGVYNYIRKDETHCWSCLGYARQRAREAATVALFNAIELATPALKRCKSPTILAFLKSWNKVNAFRLEDRKREAFFFKLFKRDKS